MKEQEYRIELLLKTYLISLSHMHLKNYEQALTGFRTLISSHINLGMAYYHFVNTALQMTTDYNINETELIKLVNKYFDIQDPKEQIIEILKVYLLIQTSPAPFIFKPFTLQNKTINYLQNKINQNTNLLDIEFELSVSKVEPVKLIIEYDKLNKPKIERIYSYMSISQMKEIIMKVNFNQANIDQKLQRKQKESIEKANDFVKFFESDAGRHIKDVKKINTPDSDPKIENLLKFARKKIGDKIEVKDFKNSTIITAKFMSNAE